MDRRIILTIIISAFIVGFASAMDKGKESEKNSFDAEVITTCDYDAKGNKEKLVNHKIALLAKLESEQESYHAEQYIDKRSFWKILIEKHNSGAKVQVITGDARKNNKEVAQKVANAGIPIWIGNIHDKWSIVVDTLIFGSENASRNAGNNLEYGIKTKNLVEQFKQKFEDLKNSSFVKRLYPQYKILSPMKAPDSLGVKSIIAKTPPSTPPSPIVITNKIEEYIVSQLEKPVPAGYTRRISTATMTLGDPIANALKTAVKNGAHVEAVLDKTANRHIPALVEAGVEVTEVTSVMAHGKTACITTSPITPSTPSKKRSHITMIGSNNHTSNTQHNTLIVVPNNSPLNQQTREANTKFAKRGEKRNSKTSRVLFKEVAASTPTSSTSTKEKPDAGAEV